MLSDDRLKQNQGYNPISQGLQNLFQRLIADGLYQYALSFFQTQTSPSQFAEDQFVVPFQLSQFLRLAYKMLLSNLKFYGFQCIPNLQILLIDLSIQTLCMVLGQAQPNVFSDTIDLIEFQQPQLDLYLSLSADRIESYTIWLFTKEFSFLFIFISDDLFPTSYFVTPNFIYMILLQINYNKSRKKQNYQLQINIINKMSDSEDSNDNRNMHSYNKSKQKNNYGKKLKSVQRKREDQDQDDYLIRENNRLRKQLVKLSTKMDDVIKKAAKNKMKISISPVIASTKESQDMELQNANKVIQRLQKQIKDYENKEAYQVSFRKITDLESIIKKKEDQIQKLKYEIKHGNRLIKEKTRNIDQLLALQEIPKNVNQNKEKIQKLQERIKKYLDENQKIKKKQLQKEQKLEVAEKKLQQLEWDDEQQIGTNQHLLNQLSHVKKMYKKAMQKVEKQNVQITKLNIKLSESERPKQRPRPPRSHSDSSPRQISKSLEQLPNSQHRKINTSILQHLPKLPKKRY